MDKRKALIYMNSTGDAKVDDMAIKAMEQYCEDNDMDVIVAFCEDTDKQGLSQLGFFTCVGMAATCQIDVVVTLVKEMIGSNFDDVMNAISWLREFETDVETLNDDVEDFYDFIYEAEEAEAACNGNCDSCEPEDLMSVIQQAFAK